MAHMHTPWGYSQQEYLLVWAADGDNGNNPIPVIIEVHTAGHGGIGVLKLAADYFLSQEAQNEAGFNEGGWLWFEEDCDAVIVLYEVEEARKARFSGAKPDGDYNTDEKVMAALLKSLIQWNPGYLKARGIAVAAAV